MSTIKLGTTSPSSTDREQLPPDSELMVAGDACDALPASAQAPVLLVKSEANESALDSPHVPVHARHTWTDEMIGIMVERVNSFILVSNKQFSFESPPAEAEENDESSGDPLPAANQKRKRKCRHNVAYMPWDDLLRLSTQLGFLPKQVINKYNNTCNQQWMKSALVELNQIISTLGHTGKAPDEITWTQWVDIGNAMTPRRFAAACLRGVRQQWSMSENMQEDQPDGANEGIILNTNMTKTATRKKPRTVRSTHVEIPSPVRDQEDIEFGLGRNAIPPPFVNNAATIPPVQILPMPRQFTDNHQVSLSYRTSISTTTLVGPTQVNIIITPMRMEQLLQEYCLLLRKLIDECATIERIYDAARRCLCAIAAWEVDSVEQRDHFLHSFHNYFSVCIDKVFGSAAMLSESEQAHLLTCRALYHKCLNNTSPRLLPLSGGTKDGQP